MASIEEEIARAVLGDVAIDQGGCFETSRPTTHENPTFGVDGVIHYCVANMPGAVPLTSSEALNNATLPYGLELADRGFDAFESPALREGLNVHAGKLTSKAVADSLGLVWSDPGRQRRTLREEPSSVRPNTAAVTA